MSKNAKNTVTSVLYTRAGRTFNIYMVGHSLWSYRVLENGEYHSNVGEYTSMFAAIVDIRRHTDHPNPTFVKRV